MDLSPKQAALVFRLQVAVDAAADVPEAMLAATDDASTDAAVGTHFAVAADAEDAPALADAASPAAATLPYQSKKSDWSLIATLTTIAVSLDAVLQ